MDLSNYKLDLGRTRLAKEGLPRIYKLADRFKHTYIIGKTGTGKSTLMLNMALYDANQGLSVIFIDPKGDKAEALNNLIKDKSRIINLSLSNPVRINPLRRTGYNLNDLIEEFTEILDLFITLTTSNPESTVLMHEIINKAVKSFKPSQRSVDYLAKFLMIKNERALFMQHNQERLPPDLAEYWKDFDARDYTTKYLKSDTAKRIASRLDRLVSDDRMKKIITGDNELDIGDIARDGKVLLVDTSRMSFDRRVFLSNLITHAIKTHCEFKGNTHPLMVYVDEFQLCFSPLFSHLLATSRSHQIGFVLAHQNMEQITQTVLGAVMGNVHTFVTFRTGDTEAAKMARVYGISSQTFLNLKDYEAYVRIGTKNIFISTDPPPEYIPELKPQVNFLRDVWMPL